MSIDYVAVLIAFTIIKVVAAILTLFRLGYRIRIHRFWWEDMWAGVALLCTVISVTSALVVSGTTQYKPDLVSGRIYEFMGTNIIWSVRMSLIFSIIRITPSTRLRRMELVVAGFFLLFWASTLGLQVWWCMGNTRLLPGINRPGCLLPRSIVIYEVANNCIADTMTALFPLSLLRQTKLPRRQRRMFFSLFTTSRFLCVFSLASLVSQLVAPVGIQYILNNLQIAAFMIVCNLLVVVTYVYRVFLTPRAENLPGSDPSDDDDDDDDDDFTTPPRTTQNLTTVDLQTSSTDVDDFSDKSKSDLFPSLAPTIKSDLEA